MNRREMLQAGLGLVAGAVVPSVDVVARSPQVIQHAIRYEDILRMQAMLNASRLSVNEIRACEIS